MEDESRAVPKPVEKRESVRGRLEYYQEVIHQHENEKGKGNEAGIRDKIVTY